MKAFPYDSVQTSSARRLRKHGICRQRRDAGGYSGHRFYPPITAVDFKLDAGAPKRDRLFLSGRNIADAPKLAVREVKRSPACSTFAVASNLGDLHRWHLHPARYSRADPRIQLG